MKENENQPQVSPVLLLVSHLLSKVTGIPVIKITQAISLAVIAFSLFTGKPPERSGFDMLFPESERVEKPLPPLDYRYGGERG